MEINTKNIIQRLKSLKSLSSDEQLADYMGVTRAAVSTWKARNTIDYGLIFEKFADYNLNYIIYGKADILQNATHENNLKQSNNTSKFEVLIAENNLLKQQLREQRVDFLEMVKELSRPHDSNIKPNSLASEMVQSTPIKPRRAKVPGCAI